MTPLPLIAVPLALAAFGLLVGTRRRLATAIGIVGLMVTVALGIAAAPGSSFEVGGSVLALTPFGRLFLVLGAASGLGLSLIGLAVGGEDDPGAMRPGSLPVVTLVAVGGLAVALTAQDPLVAFPAALGAGAGGLLASFRATPSAAGVEAARRELRVAGVAAILVLPAVAWLAGPSTPGVAPSAGLGLAYLAVATGLALRSGVFPFHAWAARLAAAAPRLALPLLLAWLPVGLLLVGLDWERGSVASLWASFEAERQLAIAVGATSLMLGALGTWLQDDLEQIVAYSVVQDAGFGLLALAAFDLSGWEPARTWLLVFVVVKSAFAGWSVALRHAFGTGRVADLRGWLRASPLLGVALVAIALATVGWPGLPVFEARWALVRLALDDPFRSIVFLGGLASLAYYGRLVAIGLARPEPETGRGAPWQLRLPALRPSSAEETRVAVGAGPGRFVPAGARRLAAATTEAWRLNRAPAAAALVLALALTGLAVAAGGFDVGPAAGELPIPSSSPAAASAGPQPSSPTASPGGPAVGPSFVPLPLPTP